MTVAADPVIEGPAALRRAVAAALETLTIDVGARPAGGSPTLVSVAVPLRDATPLDWFEMARDTGADVACWLEQPSGRALVGIGAATTVSLFGPDRFREAAEAWDAWSRDAVVGGPAAGRPGAGPMLLGGATFAEGDSSDPCWAGFERGRLDVPELLLAVVDGETTLTVSLVVRDPAQAVADIGSLLRRADRFLDAEPLAQRRVGTTGTSTLRTTGSHPDRTAWSSSVARSAGAVGRGRIDKVVLARRVDMDATRPIDVTAVLGRLARPAGSADAAPVTVFAFSRGGRTFLGASPERLAATRGRAFQTIALAGTTARDDDPAADAGLAAALLESEKDREEHAVVVEMLRETLRPLTSRLEVDGSPHIVRLPTLQHLATEVAGELRDDRSILDLVGRLHPTPAVGGWPRAAALELLDEQEHLDRGWYAGPVGWVDARGDGEFVVAIRSGVIDGPRAHLFVGCGIVGDSEPDREWDESTMKLRSLASALGRMEP